MTERDLYPEVIEAWNRIAGVVKTLYHEDIDAAALPGWSGGRVVLAREHKQASGSYRARGALWYLRATRTAGALPAAGIAVAAGTHAQAAAWAWAAATENVPAILFVPPLPTSTLRTLRGGRVTVEVVRAGDPVACRDAHASHTHALRPMSEDRLLAAGAGTWVLNINTVMWNVATVLIPVRPVDDDGLLAGTVAVAHKFGIKVVLVATDGTPIPTAAQQLLSGTAESPGTVAHRRGVSLELVTVSAEDIGTAAQMLQRRGRVVTEEGALPLAALTSPTQDPRRCYRPEKGEPVAVLLAGPPSEADTPDRPNPYRRQPKSPGSANTGH